MRFTRKPNRIKLGAAAVCTLYFLSIAFKPLEGSFFDIVALPLHEAGHVLFSPFGHFIGVAGGSLLQVIVPAVFVGYFVRREEWYSASMVLFWVGQSVINVYIYAQDVMKGELVLLDGGTLKEGSFHDWHFMLTETGLLKSAPMVAGLLWTLGTLTIVIAAVFAVRFSFSDED